MIGPFKDRRNAVHIECHEIEPEGKRPHIRWIESPFRGVLGTGADLVFSQRYEANSLELFFDLIFVANLATFTSYHSISDRGQLFSYIGFFSVIWSSWFQITLHDVRFARDSVYERACKMVQFVSFVGFALVGSGFNPSGKDINAMFQILSVTLLISRLLFVIQYAVVLSWATGRAEHSLYLPLGLNIGVYLVTSAIFAITATAFLGSPEGIIYSVGYIVLLVECFCTIAISCIWRQLSFKKSHLNERMGLLTLIVIGEGAIGVTKTISKLLGKGQDLQLSGTIFCILLVLFFTWMLYFDNKPHGHLGTIRQQLWSVLHFPLHLAIVGVVEGSQQMALARYVLVQSNELDRTLFENCMESQIDAPALVALIQPIIINFKLDKETESSRYELPIMEQLRSIANSTNLCATSMPNFTDTFVARKLPQQLMTLHDTALSALYTSVSVAPPEETNAVETAYSAWQVVYNYYWASMTLTFICLTIFHIFYHRNLNKDIPYVVAILSRIGIIAVPLSFMIMAVKDHAWMYQFIGSPLVIATVVLIHFFIVGSDMLCAIFSNRGKGRPIIVLQERRMGPSYGRNWDGRNLEEATLSELKLPEPMLPEQPMSYEVLNDLNPPADFEETTNLKTALDVSDENDTKKHML